MAAKKMAGGPSGQKRPIPNTPKRAIDRAVLDIQRRYGNNLGGAKTMKEAIQSLQDVVAESSLVEKYNSRTLDAAASRVAQNAFQGMKRASMYGAKKKS